MENPLSYINYLQMAPLFMNFNYSGVKNDVHSAKSLREQADHPFLEKYSSLEFCRYFS